MGHASSALNPRVNEIIYVGTSKCGKWRGIGLGNGMCRYLHIVIYVDRHRLPIVVEVESHHNWILPMVVPLYKCHWMYGSGGGRVEWEGALNTGMTTIAGTGCVDFSAVNGVSIAAAGRASTCQVYNTIIQQFISSALECRGGWLGNRRRKCRTEWVEINGIGCATFYGGFNTIPSESFPSLHTSTYVLLLVPIPRRIIRAQIEEEKRGQVHREWSLYFDSVLGVKFRSKKQTFKLFRMYKVRFICIYRPFCSATIQVSSRM